MPNILWICVDQQRKDALGCYGNPFVRTPNIDRLAAGGTLFENAVSQSPVCAPSRAAFLTGRYPRTCGVRQNGQDIPASEVLVTKWLRDKAGYTCGLSGKLHLSACNPAAGRNTEPRIDDGYDAFFWSHDQVVNNWTNNQYGLWLKDLGIKYEERPHPDSPYVQYGMDEEHSQAKWCTDRALSFMEAAREQGKPWCFSINYFDPHHPFNPAKAYLDRYNDILCQLPLPDYVEGELDSKPLFQRKDHLGAYDTPGNYPFPQMTEHDHRLIKAAYYALGDMIDHQVGRLLDYLEKSGQTEDTLVIYMSDHGEHLGDHGMYLKGPAFYQSGINVPLIFSMPGTVCKGRRAHAIVELLDIPQTLLEMNRIVAYPGMMGRSFAQLLTDAGSLDQHRSSAYSEYYNANVKHTDPKAFATMVYDGRWKLVRFSDMLGQLDIKGELYDLASDPGEHRNLYDARGSTQEKMRLLELLCDRMAQTCDPLGERKAFW